MYMSSILVLKKLLVVGALAVTTSPLVAEDSPQLQSNPSPWASQTEQLRQLLSVGEIPSVIERTEELLNTIESEYGLYHPYLVQPLVVLGDAQLAQGNVIDSQEIYQRALQLERTTTGPVSIQQRPILRKLGSAYVMNGNYQRATQMFEKAYELSLNHFGPGNPLLIPDSIELLEWYEQHNLHSQAAYLSNEVFKITTRMWSPDDERMIQLKRTLAKAMRDATFPPQREFSSPFFRANLPGMKFDRSRFLPFYAMGINVLRDVITSLEAKPQLDPVLYATTLIELADFYQSARRYAYSIPLYRQAWNVMSNVPQLRDRTFSEPKLLYIALPVVSNPNESELPLGHVDLMLTISEHGRVVGRKTHSVQPRNDVIEHRVRVAARGARFRPAFKNAQPVRAQNVEFTHHYPIGRSRAY